MEVLFSVPVAFGVMFMTFIAIPIVSCVKAPDSREDLDKITGELVGFRKQSPNAKPSRPGDSTRFNVDYSENGYGRLPIFKFNAKGKTLTKTTPTYSSTLTGNDVGKIFSLLCSRSLNIIIDDDISFKAYKDIVRRINIGFSVLALFFLIMVVISYVALKPLLS